MTDEFGNEVITPTPFTRGDSTEIERLLVDKDVLTRTGTEAWRQVDIFRALATQLQKDNELLKKRVTRKDVELDKYRTTLDTAAFMLAGTGAYVHKTHAECLDMIYKAARGGDQ